MLSEECSDRSAFTAGGTNQGRRGPMVRGSKSPTVIRDEVPKARSFWSTQDSILPPGALNQVPRAKQPVVSLLAEKRVFLVVIEDRLT